MKKINKFFKKIRFFLPALMVGLLIVIFFFDQRVFLLISDSIEKLSDFKIQLVATLFGVGFSIAVAWGFGEIKQYKRTKKTFGLLKLVVIYYLRKQGKDFSETMKNCSDICVYHQALAFLQLFSCFDILSKNYDTYWFQMIYSQDFLDVISSDNHFNKIANMVSEVLLFRNQLISNSVKAKHLLIFINSKKDLDKTEQNYIILKTREIRNDLVFANEKFKKFLEKLDDEVSSYFSKNGVIYTEFER